MIEKKGNTQSPNPLDLFIPSRGDAPYSAQQVPRGLQLEKRPVGFSVDYKLPRQLGTAGDAAPENEVPMHDA